MFVARLAMTWYFFCGQGIGSGWSRSDDAANRWSVTMPKAKPRKTATVLSIESPSTRAAQSFTIAESDIAFRAFEIYRDRGFQNGHDVDDWLQAERELRGSGTAAVA